MRIKTRYSVGQVVDTQCPYTKKITKNEIVGIYFDKEGVSYIFDHKTFILNAVPEKTLISIEEEQKGVVNE